MRYSNATLFLLSRFLKPRNIDNFSGSEGWKNALGATPDSIIKTLLDDGYLQESSLYGKVEIKFTANELKTFLAQRQLSISGKKGVLIQRLIDSDPDGMQQAVGKLTILYCSETGKLVSEEYLNAAKEQKDETGKQILQYLIERDFSAAYSSITSYESKQVFPRNMGYDPKREIQILSSIFKHKPKILASVSGNELESLRLYAASDFLWGTQIPPGLINLDFKTGLVFDNEAAARMLLFAARHRQNISDIKQMSSKTVEIIGAPNSCEECTKIRGKIYLIDEIIDLPYEHCTHELGCRCQMVSYFPKPGESISFQMDMKFCRECGKSISREAQFCKFCGSKFDT